MKTQISIPQQVMRAIRLWAEECYPNEGCGLLVGRFESDGLKKVHRLAPVANELLRRAVSDAPTLPSHRQGEAAGGTEFLMNPSDFNRETLTAEREGMDVVGIIHTHPDHPPIPSAIDTAQPFLAQWSNIIVGVEKGRTKEMKSWYRETDTELFNEEEIIIQDDVA